MKQYRNTEDDGAVCRKRGIIRMKTKFTAGIDGGGTKTSVICSDSRGKIIKEKKFGPFNLNSIGEKRFTELLDEIILFLNRIGECEALCIGAAGVSNCRMEYLINETMKKWEISNWKLVGDQEIALWGALEGKPGISLVAGTGSVCFGRNALGDKVSIGGWGHLLGDEGSGYAIGRDALKAVIKYWDGYGKETIMTEILERQLQIADRQTMIAYVYENDKSSVAKIARIVEEAAAVGDKCAMDILKENAEQISELVETACRRLQMMNGEAALSGGMLENNTIYRSIVVQEIERRCPDLVCTEPRQNAAAGAVMMAQNMLGRVLEKEKDK